MKVITVDGDCSLFVDTKSVHEIDIPPGHAAINLPRDGDPVPLGVEPGKYTVCGKPDDPFPYVVVVAPEDVIERWLNVPPAIKAHFFEALLDPETGAYDGHQEFDA